MFKQKPAGDARPKIVPPKTYQAVTEAVWQYLDALQTTTGAKGLGQLLHPVWNGKYCEPGGLRVEDKQKFLARYEAGGAGKGTFEVTSVQIHYGNFAMARADDRANGGVVYLTLFQNNGRWQITSEVYTAAALGTRHPHFSSENSVQEVLEAMETYYQAVEFGKPELLEPLFHGDWHMKNPENGQIVSEDKETFIARIEAGPLPGYYADRQTTDIQVFYESLAILRIDNPTTQSTTMFTFFRLEGDWIMVDKAWADPPV